MEIGYGWIQVLNLHSVLDFMMPIVWVNLMFFRLQCGLYDNREIFPPYKSLRGQRADPEPGLMDP